MKYGNLPYEHHIDQLHAYIYLWNKTQDSRIEKGLLVYMDKSSGNIYEYEVPYDEMRMDFLLDKISEIRKLSSILLMRLNTFLIPRNVSDAFTGQDVQFLLKRLRKLVDFSQVVS